MSEIQFKEVECYVCNDKIRVVFVNDIGMYSCGKLKCKIMVSKIRGVDWKPFVDPKDWEEAYEVIKDMYTKRDLQGRFYRRGKERLTEIMRVTELERNWVLERREEQNAETER